MPTLDLQTKTAMNPQRRNSTRSRAFLCFGAAAADEDKVEESWRSSVHSHCSSDDTSSGGGRLRRRRSSSRALAKIFRSVSFLTSLKRCGKERKDSNRLLLQKGTDLTESNVKSKDGGDRGPVISSAPSSSSPLFSSSAASSSPLSCSSSSLSSHWSLGTSPAVFPDPAEPNERGKIVAQSRIRLPTPRRAAGKKRGSATEAFLLVTSLTIMVFWGRVCAIMWTSWWLYLVASRNRKGGAVEVEDVTEAATVEVVLKSVGKLYQRGAEEEEGKKKERRVVFEGLFLKQKA